ncbi:NAD(+) synthase [Mycoplasma miroungirhinis]|uniref:NH(3)-dependent NAD(+) synthetase n=1 Tax=Mycoplasma miroungirhinis TaxID=754516 RepID=A0A6M4JAY4_9MOLU|nr:NAD(+) synthase [Mycoplasma miroungirhinis]QJR44154.1 NAD(+) synthase [Mycoplasma miroungirhinis]
MKIQTKNLDQIKKEYDIDKYYKLIKQIQKWLINKVKKANASGLVLGISGGIDSATLAFIAHPVFKEKLHLFSISINDNKQNPTINNDIQQVFLKLNRKFNNINLTNAFLEFKKSAHILETFIAANLKARMRMSVLYAKAQETNSLVLGTDNLNEFYLGYFTKFGDGGCDLLPLANIKKSDIYIMAKILEVPESIIYKKPSADLWTDQNDEDELGFSYDNFESYYDNKNAVSNDVRKKIEKQHNKNIHKLVSIPKGPKI